MREDYICIIEDEKLLRQYCSFCNKTFQCRDIYDCGVGSCPLGLLLRVQLLMNEKNIEMCHAFKKIIESHIPDEKKKEILFGYLRKKLEK